MSKWYINYMDERCGIIDQLERVDLNGAVGYRIRWTADNDSHIKEGYEETIPRMGLFNIVPLKDKEN